MKNCFKFSFEVSKNPFLNCHKFQSFPLRTVHQTYSIKVLCVLISCATDRDLCNMHSYVGVLCTSSAVCFTSIYTYLLRFLLIHIYKKHEGQTLGAFVVVRYIQ